MDLTECPEGAPRKLRTFINGTGLRDAEAALQIGLSGASLSGLLRGKQRAGDRARRKIERWTGGKVKATEWDVEEDREELAKVVPFSKRAAGAR